MQPVPGVGWWVEFFDNIRKVQIILSEGSFPLQAEVYIPQAVGVCSDSDQL